MKNTIPAVDKTIQILLSLSRHSATQLELSKSCSVTMSSTYRILMTLLENRWVRKDVTSRFSLAEGLLPLLSGLSADQALLARCKEAVTEISDEYQIACKLSIRDVNRQRTYFRAEPPGPVVLTGSVNSTFPLIEGTVGAALLCGEDSESLDSLIASCEEDIPEKRHPSLVRERIDEIRTRGVAMNLRQNRWNIAACSIPIRDSSGAVVAALTLIGTTEDFTGDKCLRWERILKQVVNELES